MRPGLVRKAAAWVARGVRDIRSAFADAPYSADTPENNRKWRRLGEKTPRDIPAASQRHAQDDAAEAFQRFSLCRRATGIVRGFAVGANEVRPVARHETVQELLDQFWDDPANQIGTRIGEWSNDLSVYGELGILVATGDGSRRTRVGLLDVGQVYQVVTDLEDAGRMIAVMVGTVANGYLAHPVLDAHGRSPREFDGIAMGSTVEVLLDARVTQKATLGLPVIWTRVNALASQARGLPDAYPALDAMALRDRSLFSFTERLSLVGSFVWDVECPTSMKPKQVETETKNAAAAIARGTGGVYGHTANLKLSVVSPTIGSADFAEGLRLPLQDVLTAYGHPEGWYAGGPEMSLASAGEMGSPTWTALQERQNVLRKLLKALGNYALAQFPEFERLDESEQKWDVSLPVIAGKDAIREVTVLNSELNALGQMRDLGLSEEATQREAQRRANEYGFEITDDDWEEAVIRGLPMPRPLGPMNPTTDDPEGRSGARVDREGNPSDSKPASSPGSPGTQARSAA